MSKEIIQNIENDLLLLGQNKINIGRAAKSILKHLYVNRRPDGFSVAMERWLIAALNTDVLISTAPRLLTSIRELGLNFDNVRKDMDQFCEKLESAIHQSVLNEQLNHYIVNVTMTTSIKASSQEAADIAAEEIFNGLIDGIYINKKAVFSFECKKERPPSITQKASKFWVKYFRKNSI